MERKAPVLLLGREDCVYSSNLAALLESFPQISLSCHFTRGFSQSLPEEILGWQGDFIFSFRNTAIVPRSLLDQTTIAAVNFHPGPTAYPGSGAGAFALLDRATTFGVTAHLMAEKVDSGPVIACENFAIDSTDNSVSLLRKTHETLYALALKVIPEILDRGLTYVQDATLAHEQLQWANNRRRMATLNSLRLLSPRVSEKELQLLVRALHSDAFPLRMIVHGHEFVLKEIPETGNE